MTKGLLLTTKCQNKKETPKFIECHNSTIISCKNPLFKYSFCTRSENIFA